MTTYRGEDMLVDDGFGTTEHVLKAQLKSYKRLCKRYGVTKA